MKHLLSSLAILFSVLSFAQSSVTLKGKITNPTGEKVSISHVVEENGRGVKKDLAEVELNKNGEFDLNFTVKEQTEVIFSDGNESTQLLVQPGDELVLTLNTKMFDETIQYYGKGAEKNNAIKNIALMLEKIMIQVYDFEPETDTIEVFSFIDNSMKELISIVKDYQSIEDFKNHGDQMILELEATNKGVKEEYLSNLKMLTLFSELIGTAGIDIKGVDLEGNEVSLSDYKGKLIVIDFWATWCGPCMAEMPAFTELEEKYGEEVNFISLAVYCKEKDWQKMATDFGFKNNIYVGKDKSAQFDGWQVRYIPRYVVLDKDFNVIDADAPRPSSGQMETMILKLK